MADSDLIISDLSGGRNGVDAPTSDDLPFDQCVIAENVDFRNGGLGRRRGGSVDVISLITGSTLGANQIRSIFRHDSANDMTTWEMWMFDVGNVIARLPVGTACSNPTHVGDFDFAASAGATGITAVSFNGKLFLFYVDAGGQDRNKIHGPTNAIRYVGLPVSAAPTAANLGAGAYAAIQRWYRVRWTVLDGTTLVSRSEPSPSVAFTPSGAGAGVTITKPATPSFSQATHWELEVSADDIYFFALYSSMPGALAAATPVGTATTTEGLAPSTYNTYPLSHPVGTYTTIPRAKFGVTDGNRLVVGNLQLSGFGSRVCWTPVLGSLDAGDDERMFQTATIKPYLDLNSKNGGDLTGLGQINGVIYPFKVKEVWRMTPTTSLEAPYIARRLSRTMGAVTHKCISEGEDSNGSPVLYFMSHRGPYRVGSNGLEYLGRDLEDVTRTLSGSPNINTTATVISHSVYHGDVGQWWLWFATGSNAFPNRLFIFDVKRGLRRDRYGVRGGWTEFTGPIAAATCSAMGPYTLAATINHRPWVGLQSNGDVSICDRDDVASDDGTTFLARIKTRSIAKYGRYIKMGEVVGVVRHNVGGTLSLRLTADSDFGQGTQSTSDATTASTANVYLPIKWDSATAADATSLQIQIAEAVAQAGYWEVVQIKIPTYVEGDI